MTKFHAGVIDQRVNLSVSSKGFVDETFAVSGLGDVCINEESSAITRLQLGCDLRAQALVDIGYYNLRACFGKALGDARADAASCAGDDCDMSVPVHDETVLPAAGFLFAACLAL